MNSSVTWCSATSVTSRRWAKISCSSRSNGPSKLLSRTWKPTWAARLFRRRRIAHAPNRSMTSRASARYASAPAGFRRPRGDGFTGHTGLREPHGPGDDGVEHQIAEPLHDPRHHLTGVHGAGVIAGDQDPADVDSFGFSRSCTLSTVSVSSARPRSEKNSHSVGMITPSAAGQPVDGEQAQRRLAVDQHVVVAVEHRVQRAGQ